MTCPIDTLLSKTLADDGDRLTDWIRGFVTADRHLTAPTVPACAHCGEPATCLGQYEDAPAPEYACDACCGHACEDGHCLALEDVE